MTELRRVWARLLLKFLSVLQLLFAVIPAKAGIHSDLNTEEQMDSGFRRNDELKQAHSPTRLNLFLVCVAMLLSANTAAAPRVGVVTMEPGLEYWARFGHDAILIDDRADDPTSTPLLYNYGYFDFDQPGFLLHFAQGYMSYMLAAVPLDADLAGYRQDGRGVTLQWLDLTPAQAQKLAQFLAWNARPEHATYRYDYFTQDCSTKVRDALDAATDGLLRRQLSSPSQGLTYRSEAVRLGAPLPWLGLSMHFALGPFGDRPMSRWEEAFVPMRLRDALREVRTERGTPLVTSESTLLPNRLALPPAEAPNWRWRFLGLGIGLAALVLIGTRRASRTTAALAGVFWLLCGLAGLGLAALWGLTEHRAIWGNENLLLTNPLCLLLLPGALQLARGRLPPRWHQSVLLLIALIAGVALFLKCLPFRIQGNGDWIALFLPIHLTLAYAGRWTGSQSPVD